MTLLQRPNRRASHGQSIRRGALDPGQVVPEISRAQRAENCAPAITKRSKAALPSSSRRECSRALEDCTVFKRLPIIIIKAESAFEGARNLVLLEVPDCMKQDAIADLPNAMCQI